METLVAIWILVVPIHHSDTRIEQIHFYSKSQCEIAAQKVRKSDGNRLKDAFCIYKGDPTKIETK